VGDIAEALAYAHRQGVVHRDIKPANLMLLKTGGVKITDFGIARIVATSDTRTGVVKGTPYYMAPEQITGKKVDGRSDIFSLGVVLFQLLTGQLPFTANTPTALMHKIVHDPHPDPKSLAPAVLTALVTVINLALEKRVESRYQDAGQMAAHLRQIGQQVEAVIARRKAMGKIHRK
jgi:serine/threonine-protein kinase